MIWQQPDSCLFFFLFFFQMMNILSWSVHNRTTPIHSAADIHSSAYWVWLFSARFWRCQKIPNFCCIKNIHYYYLPTLWAECKWWYLQSSFASVFVRLSSSTIWQECVLPTYFLSGKYKKLYLVKCGTFPIVRHLVTNSKWKIIHQNY